MQQCAGYCRALPQPDSWSLFYYTSHCFLPSSSFYSVRAPQRPGVRAEAPLPEHTVAWANRRLRSSPTFRAPINWKSSGGQFTERCSVVAPRGESHGGHQTTRPKGGPEERAGSTDAPTQWRHWLRQSLAGSVIGEKGLDVPWECRVLKRAKFEFAQRDTLGPSNILTPRFPWPRTWTNHISVSDIGGAKSVAVLPTGYGKSLIYLIYWSGYVTLCILQIGRSVIQLRAGIFSNTCLVPPLELGHFHCSLPDPTAF